MTNSFAEISESDVIFVIGSNTPEAHPVVASKMKRAVRNGTKLIVADPRKIDLFSSAEVAVNQKPGTDIALINGMMHVIIEEELYDQKYIEERTEGFESLKKVAAKYTPARVEEITGVAAADIVKMARTYAKNDRAAIYYAMGITQHNSGTENVCSIACLAMLTGNVGKKGTGVNPLRGQNNVQGACDMGGLPGVYPGYQKVSGEKINKKFENAWDTELPKTEGLTIVEMFNGVDKDLIDGIYIVGENPVISDPNQNHIKEVLSKIDFLVVQDIFMTETAEYADVVLPAACFAEKNGTFTNSERRIQLVNKAVDAPGKAKADWEIFAELSNKMGYQMDYDSPAEIMDEIAALTPIYGGIDYQRLKEEELQWPCTDKSDSGTEILHQDEFARGRAKFYPSEHIPALEESDDEYDYIMMTGRMLYHYHTGTMTRNSESINEYKPDAYVEINPADARKLGVEGRDKVEVASRRGKVETSVEISERVKSGQIFMPFHYRESPANRLTNDKLDPASKIPEFKVTAVKIEKI